MNWRLLSLSIKFSARLTPRSPGAARVPSTLQVVAVSASPGDVLSAGGIGASAGAGAGSVAPGRSGARVIRVGPGAKVPRPYYDMRLPFDFGMGEYACLIISRQLSNSSLYEMLGSLMPHPRLPALLRLCAACS